MPFFYEPSGCGACGKDNNDLRPFTIKNNNRPEERTIWLDYKCAHILWNGQQKAGMHVSEAVQFLVFDPPMAPTGARR